MNKETAELIIFLAGLLTLVSFSVAVLVTVDSLRLKNSVGQNLIEDGNGSTTEKLRHEKSQLFHKPNETRCNDSTALYSNRNKKKQNMLQSKETPSTVIGEARSKAERAIKKKGSKGEDLLPALLQSLQSADMTARRNAALTLGNIGPGADAAVPALIQTLKDTSKAVSSAAAYALGKIGPKARPGLIQALYDQDRNVRISADFILKKIDQNSSSDRRRSHEKKDQRYEYTIDNAI